MDRIQEALGLNSDGELSRALAKKRSTVGSWRAQDRVPYEICVSLRDTHGLSLEWLLLGEGEMYRSARAARVADVLEQMRREAEYSAARMIGDAWAVREPQAACGAVTQAKTPAQQLEASVAFHYDRLTKVCADDEDYVDVLSFLDWLLDWWEAVGPEDHAWLIGQLRRHVPDWPDERPQNPTNL